MANYSGNSLKYKIATGAVVLSSDVFHAILMNTGYTFNRLTHKKYSDIVASEMPTANGYTQNTKVLAGISVTEVDASNKVTITWTSPSWAVTPADLGPMAGMAIIDDTDSDKCIVGYIQFVNGAGAQSDQTQTAGGTFTVANVEVDIVDTVTPV